MSKRPDPLNDLNAELEKLKEAYIAELPAKTANLSRATQRAASDLAQNGSPNWRELETLSHKLAGSSGTYGFGQLSRLSRHLEDALSEGRLQHLSKAEAAEYLTAWKSAFDACVQSIIDRAAPRSDAEGEAELARLDARLGRERKAA